MNNLKIAFLGIGATGAVQAAALLKQDPEVTCIDPRPGLGDALKKEGISISGALDFHVPVKNFFPRIQELKNTPPDIIFISTKTYHLPQVLEEIKEVFRPGIKIISTHNGLGPEDLIAEKFGKDSAFRMSLNFGASLITPNHIEMAFFNPPNYIGSLDESNKELGLKISDLFTKSGLNAEYVDDIKLNVWKKMIYKCSLASICAVTDRTIKDVIDFPPTKEIALGCFKEAIAVAKAMSYDLGDNFVKDAFNYLEGVGSHKDSMCYDVSNKLPTEIDFLGGKIAEYGRMMNIPTPYFTAMSNIVRALEDSYLREKK
jgi:2-dehydropantoate 2-reductase